MTPGTATTIEPPPEGRGHRMPGACEHPDCLLAGDYRAPVAPDRLRQFRWFCREHVQAYNRAWDYCRGMSVDDIEAQIRSDSCWGRPTWRLGPWPTHGGHAWNATVADDLGGFGAEADTAAPAPADGELRRNLAVLGLRWPVRWEAVKRAYKALAKRLHPDANGGDKRAEDRLKSINEAYGALKRRNLP